LGGGNIGGGREEPLEIAGEDGPLGISGILSIPDTGPDPKKVPDSVLLK
jgi:hypothetical protein